MIKILKTIGIVLLSIVGLFILLFVIGYIVDIFSSAPLNAITKKGRADLMSYRMDIKDNAWNEYAQAIEKVKSFRISTEADIFLKGGTKVSPSFQKEVEKYPAIYPIIDQGNSKKACQIPYNYENGWKMELPNYIAMQTITKIIAIRTMQSLIQNEAEKSVDYTIQGLMFCDHIIHGGPVLINYMVGVVIYGITLKPFKYGIETGKYNADQLRKISATLSHCEEALPPLSWALKGESDISKINRFNFSSLGVRLSCWRYFFSPKLALLRGLNDLQGSIESFSKHENASLEISNNEITTGYN